MASSKSGGTAGEEQLKKMAELSKTLKEGERIVAPTRRPDGTLRKPIRIRAGYVPQDEVAIYQSRGALWKKEMESQVGPPGYDPALAAKPKTKSAKRNERKKEKRQQAALEKSKNLDTIDDGDMKLEDILPTDVPSDGSKSFESLTSGMNELSISANSATVPPVDSSDAADSTDTVDSGIVHIDIDKKIRALRKKIRLAEAQLLKTSSQDIVPERSERLTKLKGWQQELELLLGKKAEEHAAS